jgi:carboxylesterase type B
MYNLRMAVIQFIVWPTWLLVIGLAATGSSSLTINTTLGTVIGTTATYQGVNVSVFYGIPFAKPPVGALRFKPPEAAAPWTGARNASDLPNSCWQIPNSQVTVNGSRNATITFSEDCLYLNLWIPEGTTAPKAVMVWIYGGGFSGGTSTVDLYNGLTLAARKNIIVASFNYRVGPLGFVYCGNPDCPGNVGLLDQVMALKWVKDNAERLGGDPARITIFGESAGAASVGFHLLSTLSRDLYTNAIMMSSSPTVPWGIQVHDDAVKRTQTFAKVLGSPASSLSEAVAYLKSASPELMVNKQFELNAYYADLPFAPVVDGTFLTNHPLNLIAEGKVKNTSILIGVVKNEGSLFLIAGLPSIFGNRDPNPVSSSQYDTVVGALLGPLNVTTASVKDFAKAHYYDSLPPWSRGSYLESSEAICGDTLFKCPVVNFAQSYSSQVKGQVFMYSFEHRVNSSAFAKWIGVPHAGELEIFFGRPWSEERASYTDEERSLSDEIMSRISNFAKTGNPNNGSPSPNVTWPEYTTGEAKYLVMESGQMRVDQGLRFRECEFWQRTVPLLQAATLPSEPCPSRNGSPVSWSSVAQILVSVIAAAVLIQ